MHSFASITVDLLSGKHQVFTVMSCNSTLYYTAMDDMFTEMMETSGEQHSHEKEEPLIATPKRIVRIRKHNLFAEDMQEFVIDRRFPRFSSITDPSSPSCKEVRKVLQTNELRLERGERFELNIGKPMRRLALRI
ncbi:uncharacterized protein LOC108599292 [Drosophila busckii]|uniref:uncharacterized protein LOC108599292 n=1 Tax=Drosophila busckii TaxID=30019 RepID=UPI00083F360C|nr:uncharacterized protein LOC108599292 [Drosophila busckii]